jgi:phosphoglycerate-specific signal transduction histidine kinase
MKKSIEIENEITRTTQKIDELDSVKDSLQTELQNLQKSFADGKTLFAELQTGQAKMSVLTDSLKSMNLALNKLRGDFDAALTAENLESLLQSAKSTACEAQTAFDEAMEIRQKANDLIETHAEMYMEKIGKFQALKKEYNQIRAESDCEIDISTDVKDLLERNYEDFPALKFAPSFHIAVGLIAHEINRLDLKTRRAAFAVNEKSPKMSENVR